MSLYATDLIDIGKPVRKTKKQKVVEEVITPPESVEENQKKPRSEKQIAAAEKMRAARIAKYFIPRLTLLERRLKLSLNKQPNQTPLKRLNWLKKKKKPSPLRKLLPLKSVD